LLISDAWLKIEPHNFARVFSNGNDSDVNGLIQAESLTVPFFGTDPPVPFCDCL